MKKIIVLLIALAVAGLARAQEVQTEKSGSKYIKIEEKDYLLNMKKEYREWFIGYNAAFGADIASPVGVMGGWARGAGLYFKFNTNLNMDHPIDDNYERRLEDDYGYHQDPSQYHYDATEKYSYSYSAGAVINLYKKRYYCYIGGGLGHYSIYDYYTLSGPYSSSQPYYVKGTSSFSGLAEIGVMFRIKKRIMVMAGVSTFFEHPGIIQGTIGIGIYL